MNRDEVERMSPYWDNLSKELLFQRYTQLRDSWLTLEQRNRELEKEKAQLHTDLEQAQAEIARLKEALKDTVKIGSLRKREPLIIYDQKKHGWTEGGEDA